jgi:hypothetical protein
MNEIQARLTVGSVLSLIFFFILNGATDWPTALVFLVAVICGFFLSVIDLILIAIFSILD